MKKTNNTSINLIAFIILVAAGAWFFGGSNEESVPEPIEEEVMEEVMDAEDTEEAEEEGEEEGEDEEIAIRETVLGDETFSFENLSFKIPTTWSVLDEAESQVTLQLPHNAYELKLVVNATKKEYINDEQTVGHSFNSLKDARTFKMACGGPLECNGVIANGNVYTFFWEFDSSQEPPADLDGVWVPDNDLQPGDMDLVLNSVTVSDKLASLCDAMPYFTDIGRDAYPVKEEYAHLEFLGELFTANECGKERVHALWSTDGDSYKIGTTLWLKNPPLTDFMQVLTDSGFACEEEAFPEECTKWSQPEPLNYETLLNLEPFAAEMKQDDCVQCG